MESLRKLLIGHSLQPDQPRRKLERALGATIAMNIAVQIGSCQHYNQRPIGIFFVKVLDRIETSPRVERNHEVARRSIVTLLDCQLVAELAENGRPTEGGHPIAVIDA